MEETKNGSNKSTCERKIDIRIYLRFSISLIHTNDEKRSYPEEDSEKNALKNKEKE